VDVDDAGARLAASKVARGVQDGRAEIAHLDWDITRSGVQHDVGLHLGTVDRLHGPGVEDGAEGDRLGLDEGTLVGVLGKVLPLCEDKFTRRSDGLDKVEIVDECRLGNGAPSRDEEGGVHGGDNIRPDHLVLVVPGEVATGNDDGGRAIWEKLRGNVKDAYDRGVKVRGGEDAQSEQRSYKQEAH
jgi:hypothetical protein